MVITFEMTDLKPPHAGNLDSRYLGLLLSRIEMYNSTYPAPRADFVRIPTFAGEPINSHASPSTEQSLKNKKMDETNRTILERLKALEDRLVQIEDGQKSLQSAYSRTRISLRRAWIRPPMWTFEQHSPHALDPNTLAKPPLLRTGAPCIGVVTPSFNQGRFLAATIDSVLGQGYPRLKYHVQDGNSTDGSAAILETYGDRLSWRRVADDGQSHAINCGFANIDSDIMAYLNSDDTLLPGTLAYVANFFGERPDIDIVYGHRVFIDSEGLEIGRAVLPANNEKALLYAGYVPQETMFWRRRVWDKIGGMDTNLHYALDWDFMLRAQTTGFKFARAPRFLACFRVHEEQKTTKTYDVGRKEMEALRLRYLGRIPPSSEIYRAMMPYLTRQLAFHWAYKLGFVRH